MVFGDDLFELRFDADGVLVIGKFDKFFDLLAEPIEVAGESF